MMSAMKAGVSAAAWRRGALCLMALALGACAAPSPRTHFYALSAEASAAQAAEEGKGGTTVSVWQVGIPEMVDRTQLVVRVDQNKVEIADFHRWAEPLRRGIPRVLAEDLAQQLGKSFVVFAGQPAGIPPEVRVVLDVQKFDAVLGQGVSVEALWNIRRVQGESRTGRTIVSEPANGADHAAIAAAFSRALARVAQDLAAAIR